MDHTYMMSSPISIEQSLHLQVYKRFPVVFKRGKGALLWDENDVQYIDALAGIAVNSFGHCHPKIVQAIQAQAETLMHVSNFYYTAPQSNLLEMLQRQTGFERFFLCNSGVEAMEASVKLARKWGKQHGKTGPVVSFDGGFHGRSLATIAMGKNAYQQGFEPLPSGFLRLPLNDIDTLRAHIDEHTLAIAFEVIQGSGGLHVFEPEFAKEIQKLCRKHSVLMIADEVQCGIGRTGKFFGFSHFDLQPDIVAMAKALAGGLPIGAVGCTQNVADAIGYGEHGTTFGGNPLASAAALAALTALENENLCEAAHIKGKLLKKLIEKIAATRADIVEVRGLGLMIGVELNRSSRPVVEAMFKKKVLANATSENVIRIVPPLVITEEQIYAVAESLEWALAKTDKNTSGK